MFWIPLLGSLVARSIPAGTSVRFIIRSTSRHRVTRTASRLRLSRAPVKTSGWKSTAMHRLFKNPRDLLRERPMLGSRAAT